jgi:saccharopine dehydrogenase-like NADP-dependent oxidoreductase
MSVQASPSPTVLLVGGYGLVGTEIAKLLRARHPDLRLLLAGRSPDSGSALAAELGHAATVRVDADDADPLAPLLAAGGAGRPDVVVTVVNDAGDRVLLSAARRGIPVVDITRWTARVHRALVALAAVNLQAPVVLASGWMGGFAAIVAAAAAARLAKVERIFIDILYAMADRSGPDSIAYMDRLAIPFEPLCDGREHTVWPLTDGRSARFAGGVAATTWRLDTPEQSSLPSATGAGTVETRIAFDSAPATHALVAMQRLGILALLQRPRFTKLRRAILHASGPGATTRFSVEASGGGATVHSEIADAKGQAHLTAVGALISIERALGVGGAEPLERRVYFPEHFTEPALGVATAISLGVEVVTA